MVGQRNLKRRLQRAVGGLRYHILSRTPPTALAQHFFSTKLYLLCKDPFPIFAVHESMDMQLQSDDDDICAGFFYAKSRKNVMNFLDQVPNPLPVVEGA